MSCSKGRKSWLDSDQEQTGSKRGIRTQIFFHARASARRRNNKIRYLVQEDGTKCEDQEAIKRMAKDFYSN
jgi:hypothetical protein